MTLKGSELFPQERIHAARAILVRSESSPPKGIAVMAGPLVSLFMFFILCPPLSGAAEGTCKRAFDAHAPLLEPTPDPITGIWKGTVTGSGLFVSEDGVPLTLWMRNDGAKIDIEIAVQGFDLQESQGSFSVKARKLRFKTVGPNGLSVDYELDVENGKCSGFAESIGFKITLDLERTTHDVLAEAPAPRVPVDMPVLTKRDWRADLKYLEEYLPQVHANAFHTITRDRWKALIDTLRTRVDESTTGHEGAGLILAMAQAVAQIGDAHTGLHWRESGGYEFFPIHVLVFSDGVHVIAVDERFGEVLCSRIVKVGNHPTEEVIEAVCSVFSAENEAWKMAQVPTLLITPKLLHELGLIDSPRRLPLVVEHDGSQFTQIIEAGGSGEWLRAPDPRFEVLPRWRTRLSENYWFEILEERSAVYFAYNSCTDDPAKPMESFLDELLDAYESSRSRSLVIDLRNNSGGNSLVFGRHIESLGKRKSLRGRIYVLIGPNTYSSGMLNASQLRTQAGATLIGEPTGGKPNSYGEVRSFRLPHSGLKVFYSTKYFRLLKTDPPTVRPDIHVELSSGDFFIGRDPPLQRALEEGEG